MRRTIAAVLVAALVGLGAAGCGGGTGAEVEGEVSYDGQPVDAGSIAFVAQGQGGRSGGGTVLNGRYQVGADQKLTPGTYRVEIHWSKKNGKKFKTDAGEWLDDAAEGLPDKYHLKSTLTADVKAGKNTIDFKLPK